ncbi:unnamed protein product, partial [marine sediment metagenome]
RGCFLLPGLEKPSEKWVIGSQYLKETLIWINKAFASLNRNKSWERYAYE